MHVRTHVLFALLLTSGSVFSQTSATTDAAAADSKKNTPAVDKRIHTGVRAAEDFEGKRLSFPVAMTAKLQYDRTKTICLPAQTKLRGMSRLTKDGLLVRIREEKAIYKDKKDQSIANGPQELLPDYMCQGTMVKRSELRDVYREPLVIDEVDVDAIPANISGLTYGVLVVPFKYHLTGTKEFKGSGSIGPYAGYKQESGNWGASLEYVGFLGLTSIAVERNIDGIRTTDNLSGVSFGGGVIGRIRDDFQVGLIIGADRVGKSARYADNGKLWLAVSIGYAFSN
ncbi:MAG: hypothetical protein WKG03_13480 [Telluria sp.]